MKFEIGPVTVKVKDEVVNQLVSKCIEELMKTRVKDEK